MKIEIDVLRAALTQLLDHAETMKGNTVELPDDLYWFVPKESLYDPASDPKELTLGSLEDDWAQVSAIGARQKDPFGYGLVWASSLIRALGDRT